MAMGAMDLSSGRKQAGGRPGPRDGGVQEGGQCFGLSCLFVMTWPYVAGET